MKSPLLLRLSMLCALSLNTGCYAIQKPSQEQSPPQGQKEGQSGQQKLDKTQLNKLIQSLKSEDTYEIDETKTKLYLIGAPAVPGLLQLLQSENTAHQITAIEMLGIMPGSEIKPALIAMLKSLNPEVRKATLLSLAVSQGEGAFPALQEVLLHDEDPEVREKAADSIFVVFEYYEEAKSSPALDQSLARALTQALKDKNPGVRRAVTYVLRYTEVPGTADALVQALNDPAVEVRETAVHALAKQSGVAASPDLVQAFNDPAVEVRKAVISSLRRIASPDFDNLVMRLYQESNADSRAQAVDAMALSSRNERFFPYIMKALKDPEPVVRKAAMRAASYFDTWESVPALIRGLKDTDKTVTEQAIDSLGRLKSPEALPQLFEALATPDSEGSWLEEEAKQACIFILKASALETYRRGMLSKDPEVQAFARFESERLTSPLIEKAFSEGLQKASPEAQTEILSLTHVPLSSEMESRILPHVIQRLRSQERSVRTKAAEALTFLNQPETATAAVPVLADLILAEKENEDLYLSYLFSALEKIDKQAAIALCLRMIARKEPVLMDAAIFELNVMEAKAAVPALIGVVEDTTHDIALSSKISAINTLSQIGAPEAIPVIKTFLSADHQPPLDMDSRTRAAEGLATLGDLASALPVFEKVLDESELSEDAGVYDNIIRGLGNSKDPAALPFLMKMLNTVRTFEQRAYYIDYSIIDALKKIGGPGSVIALLDIIDHEGPETGLKAAKAMAEIEASSAFIPQIVERLLYQKESYVKTQLESPDLKDKSAFGMLNDAFQDFNITEALSLILAKMDSENARVAFMNAIEKAHPETRVQLIGILGKFKASPRSLSFLHQSMGSLDGEIRHAAYLALGELAEPSTAPWLRSAYAKEAPKSEARRVVLEALTHLKQPTDAPLFRALLKQELKAEVFESDSEAVVFLGDTEDVKAVPLLVEALSKAREYSTQALIAEALGKIGDPTASPVLKKALRHNVSENLKEALLTALLSIEEKNERGTKAS